MANRSIPDFAEALICNGPAPGHAPKLMLYGRLVGDWEAEGTAYLPDGSRRRHWWHIHFAWVLEGRAIQDVWSTPVRHGPQQGRSEPWGDFSDQYGTSLRVYDAARDVWDVTWIDPRNGFSARLTGCERNGEIFQEGQGSNGTRLRWIFSDVRPDTFRWRAELSRNGGETWFRALELQACRLGAMAASRPVLAAG